MAAVTLSFTSKTGERWAQTFEGATSAEIKAAVRAARLPEGTKVRIYNPATESDLVNRQKKPLWTALR